MATNSAGPWYQNLLLFQETVGLLRQLGCGWDRSLRDIFSSLPSPCSSFLSFPSLLLSVYLFTSPTIPSLPSTLLLSLILTYAEGVEMLRANGVEMGDEDDLRYVRVCVHTVCNGVEMGGEDDIRYVPHTVCNVVEMEDEYVPVCVMRWRWEMRVCVCTVCNGVEMGDVDISLSIRTVCNGVEMGDEGMSLCVCTVCNGVEIGDEGMSLCVRTVSCSGVEMGDEGMSLCVCTVCDGVEMGDEGMSLSIMCSM